MLNLLKSIFDLELFRIGVLLGIILGLIAFINILRDERTKDRIVSRILNGIFVWILTALGVSVLTYIILWGICVFGTFIMGGLGVVLGGLS